MTTSAGPIRPTNLAAVLHARARAHPERAAIVDRSNGVERVTTFAQLDEAATTLAAWLRSRGLCVGDGMLVFQPMAAELYVFLVAAWRAGLVCLFVDPSQGLKHVAACCRRWQPRLLFGTGKAHWLAPWIPGLRCGVVRLHTSGWVPWSTAWTTALHRLRVPNAAETHPGAERHPAQEESYSADVPALVTFTSGSTGVPKAVVRSHAFLLQQHEALMRAIDLRDGQVDLTTLPIFVLANLGSGVTSVIPTGNISQPGHVEAAPIARQIARWKINRGGASPAFWERMLACNAGRAALRGLTQIYAGGGPVFADLLRRLRDGAPAARIVAVYGSSEAEPIAEIEADEFFAATEWNTRFLPAGRVCPEITCAVIRDQWGTPLGALDAAAFAALQLSIGARGEIVVSGAHVVRGYLGGVGDVETKFTVAGVVWHRTGDAGCWDDHGRLWLAGRCGAGVPRGDDVIYPFEVEVVLGEVAGVRRSALVAIAHRRILAVEVSLPDVLARVRAILDARGWADLEVRAIARLPVDKRHNAKIDYAELRRLLG